MYLMKDGDSILLVAVTQRMRTIALVARYQWFRLGEQLVVGDVHKTSASYEIARSAKVLARYYLGRTVHAPGTRSSHA